MLAGVLEAAINRLLALDPASAERVLRLEGKCLQLDLEGLGISLFLGFGSGYVRVDLDSEQEPDTVIGGSPVALFSMAAPGEAAQWGLPGSKVTISGDAALARDIERLFSRLEPDWQQPFSELFGDTAGFQLASGLQQGFEALRDAAFTTADIAGRYFRDETGELVSTMELDAFSRSVDALNDATERLEARLRAMTEDME